MTIRSFHRGADHSRDGCANVAAFLLLAFLCWLPPAGVANATRHAALKDMQFGLASFYSDWFDGRQTAGGEIFDNAGMVAAHPTYPLGTVVRVSRLERPASVVVRVTDRGPSVRNQKQGVIIDLSKAAATKLRMRRIGRARVRVDVLKWGDREKKPLVAKVPSGDMKTASR